MKKRVFNLPSYFAKLDYSNGILINKYIHRKIQLYTPFYHDFKESVNILYLYDQSIYYTKSIIIFIVFHTFSIHYLVV